MRISYVVPASAPVHCAIYHQVGDCIMPREGVFCKVIEGGSIAPSTTTPSRSRSSAPAAQPKLLGISAYARI